jgi:hypothetical protein
MTFTSPYRTIVVEPVEVPEAEPPEPDETPAVEPAPEEVPSEDPVPA